MVHLGEVCKDQVSSGPPRWSTWVRYVRIRSGPGRASSGPGEVCKDPGPGPPR